MSFIFDCFAKTDTQKAEADAADTEEVAPTPPPPPPPPPKLTLKLLQQQDAKTSAAIIKILNQNKTFISFGESEAKDIISRDDEDGVKLQAGIQYAIDKGVLPELESPPVYKSIDVIGKTPDDVCKIIVKDMGSAASNGGVVVLCGLSGTGKNDLKNCSSLFFVCLFRNYSVIKKNCFPIILQSTKYIVDQAKGQP